MNEKQLAWRIFSLFAGFALLVAVTVTAWPIWRSLFIAVLLAYLFHPLISKLEEQWPGKRPFIVFFVYAGTAALLLGIVTILGTVIWNNALRWASDLQMVWQEIRSWLNQPVTLLNFTVRPQIVVDYLQQAATNAFSEISLGTQDRLLGFTDNLLWIAVIAISLYYFMLDGHKLTVLMLRRLPLRYRQDGRDLLAEIDKIWGTFLRVQLLIFVVVGTLAVTSTMLVIWIYQQNWLPISPLGLIIILIIVYTAVQQVDNLWLRPRYMGRTLQLHPGVSIIALLGAFALAGFLGALVVIPMLATLKILAQKLPGLVAKSFE